MAEWQTQRTQNAGGPAEVRAASQDSAESTGDEARPSAEVGDLPPHSAAASEPTDADLERGILDAVRLGLGDVARALAGQLEGRQRARAGNVLPIDRARRGR